MFDGSDLPFEENLHQSEKVYALTKSADIGLEAEMGAIGSVENDKIVSSGNTLLANYDECVLFCKTCQISLHLCRLLAQLMGFISVARRWHTNFWIKLLRP